MKMNLGFFSEEAAATAGDNAGSETETADNAQEQNTETKTYTHDELEAEADRRTSKGIETALKNFREKELPGLLKQAQTEAEKLARMTAEQRAEAEQKKREDDFNRRFEELSRKELRIEAHKTLTEKGLDPVLLDVLVYTDAEACNASIEAVETAFRAAVEKGVNERLKGNPPKTGSAQSAKNPFAKETLNLTEQGRIMKENPELAQRLAREAGTKTF